MTATVEFPSSALRPTRRVTAPRYVRHRPALVAEVPQVSARQAALTLVREGLDQTQLKTALSHATPAKYGELRTLTGGMRYYSPARRALAEELAVEGLLSLGTVQLHEKARQTSNTLAAARAERPRRNTVELAEQEAREIWGGARRSGLLDSLVIEILDGRSMADWDNSPAEGVPAMPTRNHAARYQVAEGVTATADELVSAFYGYWLYLDDERETAAPTITGEISEWFKATARTLWTETVVDYAVVEHADADSAELARARSIDLEREHLAGLLEDGTDTDVFGLPWERHAMHPGDRARLRFIELHLAAAFGFTGPDARARRANIRIGADRRWPR